MVGAAKRVAHPSLPSSMRTRHHNQSIAVMDASTSFSADFWIFLFDGDTFPFEKDD